MQADLGNLWQRGCERLASELPDQQFNTWIRPLPEADVSEDGAATVVTVRVPNRFKLDWIRNQYAQRIETVLSELAGKPVRLDIALALRDGAVRAAGFEATPGQAGRASDRLGSASNGASHSPVRAGDAPFGAGTGAQRSAAGPVTLAPLPSRSRLNPALTFDTLVPGRANQMARTAALHVAGS
ncbi:MAG: DnaA N-terminal domain-containing protein, partial [Caldimonas sp.]